MVVSQDSLERLVGKLVLENHALKELLAGVAIPTDDPDPPDEPADGDLEGDDDDKTNALTDPPATDPPRRPPAA